MKIYSKILLVIITLFICSSLGFAAFLPDLTIDSFIASGNDHVVGEQMSFKCTVKNVGSDYQGQWKLRIKVGTEVLETITLGPLAPGKVVTKKGYWTPTTPGPYQALCRADLGNLVEEHDETNNSDTVQITVKPKKPDLRIDLLASSPPTVKIGEKALFTCVVKNIGYGFGKNWKVRLKLGSDILATETRSGLAKDAISKLFFTWTATGPIGDKDVLCRADVGDLIDEYSNANNVKTIKVKVMPKFLLEKVDVIKKVIQKELQPVKEKEE